MLLKLIFTENLALGKVTILILALVWGPKRRYIIVALINDNSGENIIRNLVVPLERVMKKARSLDNQKNTKI